MKKINLGDEMMPHHATLSVLPSRRDKGLPLEHLDHALSGLSNTDPLD